MKLPPSYCATCGTQLLQSHRTGRTHVYCSAACRKKAYRRRVAYKQREKAEQNRLGHLSQESFEWYTPPKCIRAVKRVLGSIELDPASSDEANKTVQAQTYYTLATDGLTKTWRANTVFLNPPYCKIGNTSNQEIWTGKLLAEYKRGNVKEAIVLVTSATETTWFHRLFPYPMCFVKGRIDFTTPQEKHGGATKGSIFVYLGKQAEMFQKVFRSLGSVKMS